MGVPKITGFFIALVVIGFFAGVFSLFLSEMHIKYGVENKSDEIAVFNKLDALQSNATSIYNRTYNIDDKDPDWTDIIGGYFSSGYTALKLTFSSFGIFADMYNYALQKAGLGEAGAYLSMMITSIVLILIVVGVFIAAIVKRDL